MVERDNIICVVDDRAKGREGIMKSTSASAPKWVIFSVWNTMVQNMELSGNWPSFLSKAKHEGDVEENVWQRWKKCQIPKGLGILAWKMPSPVPREEQSCGCGVCRGEEAAHCDGNLFGARELHLNFYPLNSWFCILLCFKVYLFIIF